MYKIELERGASIDVTESDLESLDVLEQSENHWVVKSGDKIFKIEVEDFDLETKSYTLIVNNTRVKCQLKTELDQLMEKMGLDQKPVENLSQLLAPMPGLVVNVLVSKDEEIEEGTALLVLEAMKMENIIKAKGAAVVEKINVSKGDKVEKGALLIKFKD